jgi:glycosyltransferase involved in cell wall biosynthesis
MSAGAPVAVSVIMPVHNGRDHLETSLAAVKRSEFTNYELIIVDDHSNDGSAEISRKYADRTLATKVRGGPARARNLGAKTSQGDILLFLDADVRLYPDSVAKVAAELEAHPEISAVFGSYDDVPPEKNFFSCYKNLFHHYVHQNSWAEARTFWAGCGAVRRDVFLGAGGFPEKYLTASIEDVELGYRLAEGGKKIRLMKGLQVTHLKKWSLVGLLKTDIMNRAIPWARLSVEKGLPRDLNFKLSDRISGIICFLLLPVTVLAGQCLFLIPLGLLLLVLNRKLYAFFLKKRGVGFAALSVAYHWFYLFYSSAVYVFAGAFFFLQKIFAKQQDEK